MRRVWFVVTLVAGAIAAASALTFAAHQVTAGSSDLQGEHEQVVYRGVTACGVERWFPKTDMDRDAHLVNTKKIVPTTIFHLRSLAAPASLPRYNRIRPVETTMWQVTGTLLRYKVEADSDVHLVLSDSGGRTMIVEIPAPRCVGSSSPFLPSIRYVRGKFDQQFHPGSSWQRPGVQVTVAGPGFFDFLHGQSGVAPNAIEIHPVLRFAVGSSRPTGGPTGSHPSPTPAGAPPLPAGGFAVRAWVTPNPMPYNTTATLHAKTSPGASCTASVIYSTGRSPVSFNGSAQNVGSSGQVSWTWHEETSGSGGEGDATCTYRGQSQRATASFTVTG